MKKRGVLFVMVVILFGCSIGDTYKSGGDDCGIISPETFYEGMLLNGVKESGLVSGGNGFHLPITLLFNEETKQMLEFFDDGSVMKIIPDGKDTYIYGGVYSVEEAALIITFYANNEEVEKNEYTYETKTIKEEGYYDNYELYLTDKDGHTHKYVQIQWRPILEEDF